MKQYAYNSCKRAGAKKKRYVAAMIASAFLGVINSVFKSAWFNLLMFFIGFACCFLIMSLSLKKTVEQMPPECAELRQLERIIDQQQKLDEEKRRLDKELKKRIVEQKVDKALSYVIKAQ